MVLVIDLHSLGVHLYPTRRQVQNGEEERRLVLALGELLIP